MSGEAPIMPPRSAGALIASERERLGLSRADVAQRLHMSVTQIEALESGDLSRLAGGPFLKGFIRNYARVLGVDPEPLVSLVLRDVPVAPPPTLAVPNQGIRFDPLGRRLSPTALRAGVAALGVIVLGIGVLYWWLNVYPAPPAPVAVPNPTAVELPGMAPALPGDPPPAATPAPTLPPAASPESPISPRVPPAAEKSASKATMPTPIPQPAAAPVPASPAVDERVSPSLAGLARLRVQAAERTWVEILDGNGDRVASRHVEPGGPAEFLGRPPLRVAVGNAPGTRITFNGRDVDLAPHTRASVARLTLE